MHEKYLPTTTEGKLSRLQEECAEVIQSVCKIQRFGILNKCPNTGIRNIDSLRSETEDLEHAIDELKQLMNEL